MPVSRAVIDDSNEQELKGGLLTEGVSDVV